MSARIADRAVMGFGKSTVHAAGPSRFRGMAVLACNGRTVDAFRVDDGNPASDVAGVAGCKRCRAGLAGGSITWADDE
jgi:hypothetical protein